MSYTFFAVGCYIALRSARILLKEYKGTRWYKIVIKALSLVTLYAALASLITWYFNLNLLGFDNGK